MSTAGQPQVATPGQINPPTSGGCISGPPSSQGPCNPQGSCTCDPNSCSCTSTSDEETYDKAQITVYIGDDTPNLKKYDIVALYTKEKQPVLAQHISTLIDEAKWLELDLPALPLPYLVPYKTFFERTQGDLYVNMDIADMIGIRAGLGQYVKQQPMYNRQFKVPKYIFPLFKTFISDLGDNLETKQDALGSKGIIIKGAKIAYGVLEVIYKIVSATQAEELTEHYNTCYAAFDSICVSALPNYGVAKEISW